MLIAKSDVNMTSTSFCTHYLGYLPRTSEDLWKTADAHAPTVKGVASGLKGVSTSGLKGVPTVNLMFHLRDVLSPGPR